MNLVSFKWTKLDFIWCHMFSKSIKVPNWIRNEDRWCYVKPFHQGLLQFLWNKAGECAKELCEEFPTHVKCDCMRQWIFHCVLQTPVAGDTADLMVNGSSEFYMQSPLPACIFFCVGGYMIHKSWLIRLCGCSSEGFSRHLNSSTQRHIRDLAALLNHDASLRHSPAVEVKVLVISLWVSLPAQLIQTIHII